MPIIWVVLAPGERPESVVDRRGGVDLLLGGPDSDYDRFARAGRLVRREPAWSACRRVVRRSRVQTDLSSDPRVDPGFLAAAKAKLLAEGWPEGYEGLVRAAARRRSVVEAAPRDRWECLALIEGGPNPTRAAKFLEILESKGLVESPPSSLFEGARADDLLADLLGAALVDALDELREADAALDRFGHPARAEAAIGERPPWPPASVAKLQGDPNGAAMVETLLEQVAPDPKARAWLVESWSRPRRAVDGALLIEIAGAADGRLALEPRFRAWLRGEWTAWTRQLYRRVARVAGGYIAS